MELRRFQENGRKIVIKFFSCLNNKSAGAQAFSAEVVIFKSWTAGLNV